MRLELREWLRRFHDKRHVTTLLVTHDQEEAMEVSDHVVVMHEGRVAQVGQPQEVYDRPATPFVASFVGGANVLHGHMREGRASVGDRASVGSFVVNMPDGTQAPDGTAVNAFVRPHDVTLTKAADGVPEVSVARVERLTWLGGYVKVALKLSDGAPMTVEMPKSEVEALAIREGDLRDGELARGQGLRRGLLHLMRVHGSITETVGRTPLVELARIAAGRTLPCGCWRKLESRNPGGSVKDRIGIAMVEDAERRGVLKPGADLVEPTSGNTGVGAGIRGGGQGLRADRHHARRACQHGAASRCCGAGAEMVLTPASRACAARSRGRASWPPRSRAR